MASSLDSSLDLEAQLGAISGGLELIAFRRLGDLDDARDAVQETLARLLSRVRDGRVGDRRELELVAYGILRHVVVDVLRSRGRALPIDPATAMAPGDALQALVDGEERARLRAGLAALSPSDRDLLRRCFLDGHRVTDIAADLGEPAERVRKRKSRALARLVEIITGRPVDRSRNGTGTDV